MFKGQSAEITSTIRDMTTASVKLNLLGTKKALKSNSHAKTQ
jgi:hypothetical protein